MSLGLIPRMASALGGWVNKLREKYTAGELPQAQVAALEEIEGWSWRIGQGGGARIDFEVALAALKECQQPDGMINFPARQEVGFSLRDWVYKRRRDYRQHRLRPDQISDLEAIPGWTWESTPRR